MNLFRYLSARRRLIQISNIIDQIGEDNADAFLLAQKDMNINETTYYYYKTIADIIFILIFIAVCGTIYGDMNEEDLRTLWSRICSWYAQTMAWGQLQAETIINTISR